VLAAAIANGASVTHFEIDEVSLEQIFIDHVGRPADADEHLAPGDAPPVDGDGSRRPRPFVAPRWPATSRLI
jgi:hypothetical protein